MLSFWARYSCGKIYPLNIHMVSEMSPSFTLLSSYVELIKSNQRLAKIMTHNSKCIELLQWPYNISKFLVNDM